MPSLLLTRMLTEMEALAPEERRRAPWSGIRQANPVLAQAWRQRLGRALPHLAEL